MAESALSAIGLVLLVLLVFYGGASLLVYLRQHQYVYYPFRELIATPAAINLPFEELTLRTTDGVGIHAWYVPGRKTASTLLFCHGNAGNISHRLDSLRIFHQLGLSVLIFDYRGYGHSEGTPSEAGTYRDAEAALRYLTEQRGVPVQDIVFFGRSLGGAVAARLATWHAPRALILESTFSSAPELAGELLPLFPMRYLVHIKYDALKHVRTVHVPLLIVHSTEDDIVPYSHAERLYAAAGSARKTLLPLRGDHNTGFLISGERYVEGIRDFLARLDARPPETGSDGSPPPK